jgi:hypothetical protein
VRGTGNGGGTRVVARFGFKAKLVWRAWGRCTRAYIGVWEESGRIKIRIG